MTSSILNVLGGVQRVTAARRWASRPGLQASVVELDWFIGTLRGVGGGR